MTSILYLLPGVRQAQIKLNQLTSYIPPPPPSTRDDDDDNDAGTPRKILMVHGHPDPVHSYSAAIANQVEDAAKEAGHEIRRISLYSSNPKEDAQNGYSPKFTKDEHQLQHASGGDLEKRQLAKEVKEHLRLLLWCDTLIVVYPTWWMNTPAAVKGFFDRTLVHDIAWSLPQTTTNNTNTADGTPAPASTTGLIPKLTNITHIVGVSTYGAPYSIVTLAGDNGRRMIANAIRPIVSPSATVAWLGLYDMDNTTHEHRTEFLGQVRQMIQTL
jgi:putative NADPH-quinone reductase